MGSNGTKGRHVAPLPTFTFQDTGITVSIRKVSPLLGMELRKAFPPPKPPIHKVEIGGQVVEEANEADPDYERAYEEWTRMLEEKATRLYIKRGVECEVDQATVDALRSDMREMNIELDPDDKYVFIRYIAVGTQEDYQELITAITRRSQPTEVAVAEATEVFQPAVSG